MSESFLGNVKSTTDTSPARPPEQPTLHSTTAQALLFLSRGIEFPDHLYDLIADRTRTGPIASTELLAHRLEVGESIPAEDQLPPRETLLAELRESLMKNRFGTHRENEAAVRDLTNGDDTRLQRELMHTLERAEAAYKLMRAGGSRSTGQLLDHYTRVMVPLAQLAHPRLHRRKSKG